MLISFSVQLLVDDLLVYNGTLDINNEDSYRYHAILFTDDAAIRQREHKNMIK